MSKELRTNGYLSKFEGTEVDAAVERVQGLDAELDLKVDKTTTINDIPLTNNIVLTAEDIGAIPTGTIYGRSLTWEDNILSLRDQQGRVLSNAYIEIDQGKWGHIIGDLSDQTDLQNALNSKQPLITSSAKLSSDLVDDTNNTHKFATSAQLTQINTNKNNISTINGKIPAQASTSNQLADKAFVNSSVQTATANFRGNWSTWANVPTSASSYPADYAGSTTPTVNDYMVVQDASGYTGETLEGTWRFKYSGTWATDGKNGWLPEYQVNETPLTAEQLAALNSGITSTSVAQITTNKDNISAINDTINNFGNIVTHNVGEFATAAQGAKADTALQSISSSMVTGALGYTPLRYAMVITDYTI